MARGYDNEDRQAELDEARRKSSGAWQAGGAAAPPAGAPTPGAQESDAREGATTDDADEMGNKLPEEQAPSSGAHAPPSKWSAPGRGDRPTRIRGRTRFGN